MRSFTIGLSVYRGGEEDNLSAGSGRRRENMALYNHPREVRHVTGRFYGLRQYSGITSRHCDFTFFHFTSIKFILRIGLYNSIRNVRLGRRRRMKSFFPGGMGDRGKKINLFSQRAPLRTNDVENHPARFIIGTGTRHDNDIFSYLRGKGTLSLVEVPLKSLPESRTPDNSPMVCPRKRGPIKKKAFDISTL